MNGGNESSGADRPGGPVATSVPIGWQRCVREGAVLYIRYRFSEFPELYPQALQLPDFCLPPYLSKLRSLVPCCSPVPPSLLSLFAVSLNLLSLSVSSHIPYPLPFLGRYLTKELSFRSIS